MRLLNAFVRKKIAESIVDGTSLCGVEDSGAEDAVELFEEGGCFELVFRHFVWGEGDVERYLKRTSDLPVSFCTRVESD